MHYDPCSSPNEGKKKFQTLKNDGVMLLGAIYKDK
jgi:hypothetical protein